MAKKEKKLELRPLDDRIVVERVEAEEKTAGGILLPDTAKEKPQKGSVLAVGPGKLLDSGTRAKPDVKVGDTVKARCHVLKDGSTGCLLGFLKARDGSVKDWDGGNLPAPAGF